MNVISRANVISRVADKTGVLGSILSAMGCAACFPAIASLGAAIGLGFLSKYEGLFLNTLLPLFAAIALLVNALGWFSHHQWHRSVLGVIGPLIVLAALYLFFGRDWTDKLLYTGLAFMVTVSIWDLFSPANRRCGPDSCEIV